MAKAGEMVMWRCPLDEDYSYGTIIKIKHSIATVQCSGYYAGVIAEVPISSIKRLNKGGARVGSNKKSSKRSTTQIEL